LAICIERFGTIQVCRRWCNQVHWGIWSGADKGDSSRGLSCQGERSRGNGQTGQRSERPG
jgi:hypothetical protein